MIGIIVNVISVAVGGVCGTLFGHKMSQAFTEKLTCVFGVCAMVLVMPVSGVWVRFLAPLF